MINLNLTPPDGGACGAISPSGIAQGQPLLEAVHFFKLSGRRLDGLSVYHSLGVLTLTTHVGAFA